MPNLQKVFLDTNINALPQKEITWTCPGFSLQTVKIKDLLFIALLCLAFLDTRDKRLNCK